MVFYMAKHTHADFKLCINNVPIQQVINTTFSGVVIGDDPVQSHVLHQHNNNSKRNQFYL